MASIYERLVLGSKDLAKLPATKSLDTRGMVCPFPAFETGKLAQSAGKNDVLEIVSNDEYAATNSIPSVLKIREFESAITKNGDGTFSIKARKT